MVCMYMSALQLGFVTDPWNNQLDNQNTQIVQSMDLCTGAI